MILELLALRVMKDGSGVTCEGQGPKDPFFLGIPRESF